MVMFVNGTYIVPHGQLFPYLGEVKWGRDPEGEIKAVIVKEIVGLKWLQSGRVEVAIVLETKVEKNDKKEFMKKNLAVFHGTVQERTSRKSQKGSIR